MAFTGSNALAAPEAITTSSVVASSYTRPLMRSVWITVPALTRHSGLCIFFEEPNNPCAALAGFAVTFTAHASKRNMLPLAVAYYKHIGRHG